MAFISLGTLALAVPMLLCRGVDEAPKQRALVDPSAWTDIPFIILTIGGFVRYLGFFTPVFFLPLFAETALGLSQKKAVDLLLIFNCSSFLGRLTGSVVAQRTRIMAPWLICTFVSGAMCLAWAAVSSFNGAVAFAFFFGFFLAPLTVFSLAVVPYFCPSMEVLGTRMGIVWAAGSVAFLIGSPVGSSITDTAHGHFLGLQLFSGLTLIVGGVMLLPLWTKVQMKQRQAGEGRGTKSGKGNASISSKFVERYDLPERIPTKALPGSQLIAFFPYTYCAVF